MGEEYKKVGKDLLIRVPPPPVSPPPPSYFQTQLLSFLPASPIFFFFWGKMICQKKGEGCGGERRKGSQSTFRPGVIAC